MFVENKEHERALETPAENEQISEQAVKDRLIIVICVKSQRTISED